MLESERLIDNPPRNHNPTEFISVEAGLCTTTKVHCPE